MKTIFKDLSKYSIFAVISLWIMVMSSCAVGYRSPYDNNYDRRGYYDDDRGGIIIEKHDKAWRHEHPGWRHERHRHHHGLFNRDRDRDRLFDRDRDYDWDD